MSILLTRKEILASMGTNSVDCLACGMSIESFEISNKAQLKKIMKFIGGVFSEKKWETLLKEIE